MKNPIKLILATNKAFNRLLSAVIEKYYLEKIGEATTEIELIELLKNQNEPVTVLLDIEMRDVDFARLFSKIKKDYPLTKIIIISDIYFECVKTIYMDRGADGYLHWNCLGDDGLDLYHAILKAGTPDKFACSVKSEFHAKYINSTLEFTQAEIEIFPFVYEGLTIEKISEKSGVKVSVVKRCRSTLFRKTGSNNKQQFIQFIALNRLSVIGGE